MNGILRSSEDDLAPYLLLGVGAYRLQAVGQSPSPYGTTGALQAGFGIDGRVRERLNAFVEARAQIHVTDYGSNEWSPTVYWPVLIGLQIQ
ncbi:MAG: hypothetical protein M3P24_02125 [Gemmatimonadota bacterium]|nr:hypothetical protein [Gemmatimonadota bacterium]